MLGRHRVPLFIATLLVLAIIIARPMGAVAQTRQNRWLRNSKIPDDAFAAALKAFEIQRFRLELVAAEPDVADPVDACL